MRIEYCIYLSNLLLCAQAQKRWVCFYSGQSAVDNPGPGFDLCAAQSSCKWVTSRTVVISARVVMMTLVCFPSCNCSISLDCATIQVYVILLTVHSSLVRQPFPQQCWAAIKIQRTFNPKSLLSVDKAHIVVVRNSAMTCSWPDKLWHKPGFSFPDLPYAPSSFCPVHKYIHRRQRPRLS